MERELIPAEEFCNSYQIEVSLITVLHEQGLIQLVTVEEKPFIPADQIEDLERIVRLHHDLDINLEGIEAINHLLQRMRQMQENIRSLSNRLRLYEGG